MAEKAPTPNYDSDVAAIVVDANCDKLVQSMDPVSSALKLVSFGLISSQQAQDILDDRVKTRSERNLAFLNLIKSSPDPTWFSSLLAVLGEERITEGLKEVLEKSYRTVELERCHKSSHASQIATKPEQSSESSSCVSSPTKKPLLHVRDPLEVEFMHLKDTLVKFLDKKRQPTVKELRETCSYLVMTSRDPQPLVAHELERAESYAEVLKVVFLKLCRWLHFSFLEMIADYFSLEDMQSSLEQYKKKLQPVLQKKFECMEAALKEAKVTKDTPPDGMKRIVVSYNLDAGGITLEDVASYRQFLSSIWGIPSHLLVLISVLYGSLLLELWIPQELTPRVVRRVEEVWRELWRRKVEGIEVGDRSFDLLQQSNTEKVALLKAALSAVAAAELWKGVLSSFGTRLYEEYGRHESLQSCVRKHKEAGCKSPEDLGALEWLLLHHTSEVAERENRDPLGVLLTTLYLGCCDVEGFVKAVMRCLEDDPALERRLQVASKGFAENFWEIQTSHALEDLITELPDEVVTKLYLKYCHMLSSLPVKDPQHLSHEEAEKVKGWLLFHRIDMQRGATFFLAIVEAGVTDEELGTTLLCSRATLLHQGMSYENYYKLSTKLMSQSKMRRNYEHSREDVRAIQISFRRYLARIRSLGPASPDHLLQAANSQRREIFQLFREELEEQKADIEPHKSYLRGTVPPHYQQDLEQTFLSAGAVAMATSSTPKEKPMSGAALGSPTKISSGDASHPSHLAEVKRQFQLQVAELLLTFSSAPRMKALSEELAHSPLFLEQKSGSDMLLSAEDSSYIINHLLQLWSWYEVSLLKLVTGILLGFKALEELDHFVKTRDDSLKYTSLPDCFPQGPLRVDQLAPTPGYALLQLTLPSCPEDIFMGHLWSLKKQLCSSLALQPYALLLKDHMEGSARVIFYISQRVSLDEDQVAAMFVGAKRAGLYPHSITTGLGTAQEVEHRLLDMLPAIKRGKVRGQMEGLAVAGKEEQSATDTAQQK